MPIPFHEVRLFHLRVLGFVSLSAALETSPFFVRTVRGPVRLSRIAPEKGPGRFCRHRADVHARGVCGTGQLDAREVLADARLFRTSRGRPSSTRIGVFLRPHGSPYHGQWCADAGCWNLHAQGLYTRDPFSERPPIANACEHELPAHYVAAGWPLQQYWGHEQQPRI